MLRYTRIDPSIRRRIRAAIEKAGVDLGFIGKWTTGFPVYAETAMGWTPERVEQVTGVPGHAVAKIGEVLMAHRPAAFMIGLGLQKSMQGAEAARAVALAASRAGCLASHWISRWK